jgi:hypothetical protein
MWQKLKNFASRHKKKLIFSGVVIGGAVFTWRVVLPKLQERLLKKLLEEAGGADILKQLAGASSGTKKRSREEFEHKQEVSDAYARQILKTLREMKFPSLFRVSECQARLQEANLSRDAKMERFREMQVECLARAVAAMYTVVVLMLLCRVTHNIIGRSIGAAGSTTTNPQDGTGDDKAVITPEEGGTENDEAHEAFLKTSTKAFEEQALDDIASSARSAVAAHCEREGIVPTKRLESKDLQGLLHEVCLSIDEKIFATKSVDGAEVTAAAAILPESLDKEVAAKTPGAKAMLDEARDYLESPQFLAAARRVIDVSIGRFVEHLGEATSTEIGTTPFPVLAKMFGPLMELSNTVLEADAYAAGFTEEPVVKEFCEAMFFQGGGDKEDGAGCPQQ